MKISYDKEVDAAYIKLSDHEIVTSEEISHNIVYDYDADYNVVGIEILCVKKRSPEEIKQLNFPFTQTEKQQLKQLFSVAFA